MGGKGSGGRRENAGRRKVKNPVLIQVVVTAEKLDEVKDFIKEVNVYEKIKA